jgi:predicted metal-dependent hydrolase
MSVPQGIREVLAGERGNANEDFATPGEVVERFGGNVALAIDSLNKFSCALEDENAVFMQALQVREQQLNEAIEIAQFYQARHDAYERMLTDPGILSEYYLALEAQLGEIQLPQEPQMHQESLVPQQYGGNPAEVAAQYQQAMRQHSPVPHQYAPMPPMANGSYSLREQLEGIAPSQWWQAIDQAATGQGFRGSRLVLS